MLVLAAALVQPEGANEDGAKYLAALSDNSGGVQASTLLFYFGFMTLLPGVLGLLQLLRRRAVALGHVAAALAVLGLVSLAALVATSFHGLALSESPNRDEAVRTAERVEEYTGSYFIFVPALAGTALGLLLIVVAIWRAGFAPPWIPLLVLVGVVLFGIGTQETLIVGSLALVAAFGFLGSLVLALSDQEWERGGRVTAEPAAAG